MNVTAKRIGLLVLLGALFLIATAQVTNSIARRFGPITFAALGAPSSNNVRWCSDCTAGAPCTGSGTGAYAYRSGGAWNCGSGASGTGNVVGPASSTDNAVARYDSTTGKLIQNSALTIADTTGALDGPTDNDYFGGTVVPVNQYLKVTGGILGLGTSPSTVFLIEGAGQNKMAAGGNWKIGFASTNSGTPDAQRTNLDTYFERAAAAQFKFNGGIQYTTGSKPTCNAGNRGTTWYVAGGAGVLDTLELCRKDAGDAYAWVSLF